MTTDPLYYVVQLCLFPVGAVLCGVFLRYLSIELAVNGWLSPRCVWQTCLCISSFSFCVLQLDPSSVLGILPTPWRNFVRYIIVSFLLNSACCTFYMYMIVLSVRHLSKIPLFTNVWVGANVITTLANCLVGIVGAITDNAFWFGICDVILIVQRLFIVAIINVSLHKMLDLFRELEVQSSASYASQRRKLWIIRIVITALILLGVLNEITEQKSDVYAITHPKPTRGFDPQVFDVYYPIPDVLIVLSHCILLYALQRPAANNATKVVSFSSTPELPSPAIGTPELRALSTPELPSRATPELRALNTPEMPSRTICTNV